MVSKYQVIFLFSLFHNIIAWNPNNYPFLPANADSSNIRKLIIDAQGSNSKILDVGCGLGYSTSDSEGSIGIDVNIKNIKKARKKFPNKKFRRSFINIKNPDEEYDIVTSMFFFHEIPQYLRKKILINAINIAKKRVIIVDIDPSYDATLSMSKNKPFLNDYFENIRDDLKYFNESVLVKGLLSIWVYDKENNNNICNKLIIENTDDVNKNDNNVMSISEYFVSENIENTENIENIENQYKTKYISKSGIIFD